MKARLINTQRAIELLRPIYDAQWQHILLSKVLAMDETPIKAGKAGRGNLKATWYWPVYGEEDEICFTWSNSRGKDHVIQQLGDFEGTLLTDGYAAYDAYAKARPQVRQAQCWAHTRRYFERAQDNDPAANEALDLIGALYQAEARIRDKGFDDQAKLDYRSCHALPIVDAFFGWCYQQRQRLDLVNSSPLAKALVYADNHQAQLRVYLGDPHVPIDTNHVERALRVIPMGRKNWLFCWSEIGAKHVGIIQSLLTTCRLHQVDPYTYLVDVLQRISRHAMLNNLHHGVGKPCLPENPCARILTVSIDIDGLSYEELLNLNHRVVERLKMLEAMQAHVDMMAFNLGARVSFDSQHGRQLGTLVKYNRKTVTVLGDDGRQWRISPGLLSPVKDAEHTANKPRKSNKKKRLR